ncbi:MAG: ATP-binding protein [Desulfosporosinus sp.]|nr:ATP-binding protein [Desulfosporosinus sp.]
MAAGIGHEVRNPMTTVRGYLQLLGSKEEFSKYNGQFALMIDELDRANAIITEFLSLAKDRVVELNVQSLKEIVQNIFPLIQADGLISDKYIQLELDEVEEIPLDKKEIHQLILNLVLNGSQAMSPGGTMKIRTFMDKEEIVLSVEDDGKGITPEVLGKIGTPFFTTKEYGTGLGLAVCYSIVARHNAKIDIETGPTGTTFFVRFKK